MVSAPSPTPSPGPTPTPTPTATPTPSPVGNTSLLDLSADRTFNTPYGFLVYGRTTDSRVSFIGTNAGLSPTFAYVAAPRGYSIRNITGVQASVAANPTVSFTDADRVASESDARFTTYQRTIDGFDFYLKLFNPGTGNNQLALTYSSIGLTRQSKSGLTDYPTFTSINAQAFAFGFEFPATGTPPTGTLAYSGVAIGEAAYLRDVPGAPVYRVSGTVQLSVEFATGNVSGTITLTGTDDKSAATVGLGTYSVVNGASGLQIVSPTGPAIGSIQYATYGPAAQELAGAAGVTIRMVNGEQLYMSLAFATKR